MDPAVGNKVRNGRPLANINVAVEEELDRIFF